MQDFQRFIDKASIPSFCFGPGLEDLAHKANERVSLGKVVQAARVYALSAVTLLEGKLFS